MTPSKQPEVETDPPGLTEWYEVLRGAGVTPEDIAERIGINGLNWMIEAVLDEHYPADIFPPDIVMASWLSNEGGREFGPGIRWVALLRAALKELE